MKPFVLIVALAAALPMAAQTPSKPAPPTPKAAAAAASTPTPQLTEVLQLRLENVNLKAQNLQQQFQSSPQMEAVRAQYSALMADIQKAYPGYRFDGHNLIKLPTAARTAPAPQPKHK